jgi:hypothetical protein
MAVLLENQAAQTLKEHNSLGGSAAPASSGAVAGFQNVAFPIVRRVFGGLVANELVSIQPMSLPAGLLFYLDYTYGSDVGGTGETYSSGGSIYNNPVGAGIRSGSTMTGGQYDLLGSGYSRQHSTAEDALTGSATATLGQDIHLVNIHPTSGVLTAINEETAAANYTNMTTAFGNIDAGSELVGVPGQLLDFDSVLASLVDGGVLKNINFLLVEKAALEDACGDGWLPDYTMLQDIVISAWQVASETAVQGVPQEDGNSVDPMVIPSSIQPGAVYNLRRFIKLVCLGDNN